MIVAVLCKLFEAVYIYTFAYFGIEGCIVHH